MYKTPQHRTTFGSWGVEKVHTVVARSTFPSQNVQNTRSSDHFWRLRGRVSKKCTPLWPEAHFEVKMCKTPGVRTTFGSWDVEKFTPLWREAHFQVKMYKAHHVRTTSGSWDVEKVLAVVVRSTFWSQKCKKLRVWAFFDVKMSKK